MGSETCIFKIFADFDVILAIFGAIKFEKITFSKIPALGLLRNTLATSMQNLKAFG